MSSKERSPRSAVPAEMAGLTRWIEHFRPRLFIESGADLGYSGECICEALDRYVYEPEFYTLEIDPDRAEYTRQRLERFSFARVITGDTGSWLRTWDPGFDEPVAFFIDGPKSVKMVPVFREILRRFTDIRFIAIHDCVCGSTQRKVVQEYFGHEYVTLFAGAPGNRMGYVFPSLGPLAAGRELQLYRLLRWARSQWWMRVLPFLRRTGR